MSRSFAGSLWVSLMAAIGSSSCCLAPLILLLLGFNGSWVVVLTRLSPFRFVFIAIVLVALALAAYLVFRDCRECSLEYPWIARRRRMWFYGITLICLLTMASPWLVPFLL